MIRLEQIRPAGFPAFLGISSENAAHRIAVEWQDAAGNLQQGVYIPRRDSSSFLNHLAGGRIFPGEHHLARYTVSDDGEAIDLQMQSSDGVTHVHVRGRAADALPPASCFSSLAESSGFFQCGSLGYSATRKTGCFDALRLETREWRVRPLALDFTESSYFNDRRLFPSGTIEYDHALVMRDVAHEWHGVGRMQAEENQRLPALSRTC